MATVRSRAHRPAKWQRRPEARPEEILCAAVQVFGEEGFARTKLEDVARKAGVSKGTLYLYFDSKDTLFREMVKARITPVFAEAEQAIRGFQGSARALLEWMIRCMWDTIRRPEMIHIARIVHAELASFPELARFYFDEVIQRNRALLREAVERGLATGEFRRVSHDFILRAVPSLLVHGAMYQRGFGVYDPTPITDDQLLEGVLDLVMNGVLTRPDATAA
jgi:AcrR family transcriptional regulator